MNHPSLYLPFPPLLSLSLFLVSYSLNEDPRVLLTIDLSEHIDHSINNEVISCVTLSPESLVVAVAVGTSLYVFDAIIGELLESFIDVHNGNYAS